MRVCVCSPELAQDGRTGGWQCCPQFRGAQVSARGSLTNGLPRHRLGPIPTCRISPRTDLRIGVSDKLPRLAALYLNHIRARHGYVSECVRPPVPRATCCDPAHGSPTLALGSRPPAPLALAPAAGPPLKPFCLRKLTLSSLGRLPSLPS